DPTFAQSYYQLACIAREQGQWKEAIKQAEQALLFDPHHIETLIFLSIIFMEQNDWKRAESFVRQANFKQPGNPDVQKIVEQYEKVIKENPDLLQKNDVCKIPDLTNTEFVKNRTSIIIAAASNHSRECITAIKKHTKELYELIVIDALASPDSKKKLKKSVKEHSPYRIMEHNAQDSLLQSINKAINCSTGEYIVLLNDDVIVSEGWLAGMLSCLNLAPSAGIIGPMTNKCKDRKQAADESYSSINNLDKYAAQFKEKYNHRRIPYRNIARFCMLFKRSLAEKIGLLDESFTAGRFDDEDFCWRSALADYQNYIAGDVFVHCHGENESSGNGNTIDQKWDISTATLDGKKMAVLKATELSDDLYSRGKVDQAVETLVDCIKITPEADKIYFELIRIFLETKKFGEAWAVIETMPDAAKNKIQTLEYSGYVKEGLGLDNEANDYADKILSSNENYSAALNLKGVLAFKKGEKDKALDYFKRAVNENPGCGDAYANLSVLYWKINSKEEAFVHIQKGFRLSPTVPDNQSIYHSMASSLGRFAAAEADFRKACRLYPHHKNLAFLVIDLLLQQGNLNSAILEIEDALDTFGLDEGTLNAALAVREKIGPLQVEPGTKNNTLSLCMIVKNEENNLVRCLKSIRDIVDEMIIVDTGSTDKTKVLSKIFGAKVYDFPWTGDFSAARNHSLAQAAGDWILILDADEIISALDHDELKTLVNRNLSSPAAYSFDTRNYIKNESVLGWTPNDGKYPEETHHGWMTTAKVRLFPRKKNVFFINPVHEIVDNSLQQAAIPIFNCNVVVHHYGKLDLLKDMQKGEDYYLLGKMKYESNPANVKYIHELAKQAHLLGKYEEAKELWLKL
ncbi:MAG: glycosyltransferase, partial [Smithella sp.]